MKGSLNNREMEGITPEYVMQLGKEWFESMVDTTPDEELSSLPKFEHLLVQKLQDGEQKGEARMLTRQLQRRFGNLPVWVSEKIAQAAPSTLEEWSLRIWDAPTLESVLADLS
ncbi:MAG: DUF4351 domain-containing protein [Magnetococcales bacterium]|nr:DUF4351 domain-containing protein [Magnetococcales bacterium]